MSHYFVQRQFAGFMAPGDDTDPVLFDPTTRVWQLRDTYPSNILKLANGKTLSGSYSIAASGSGTAALPPDYDSANRLWVLIKTSKDLKIVIVDPVLGSSTITTEAGTASDEAGILCFCGRVTSITLDNSAGAAAVTVETVMFEMPDLSDADSWRDGYQTTGVVSS